MSLNVRKSLSRPHPATWLAWLLPVFVWAPLTYPGYFEFLNGFSPIFNLNALRQTGLTPGWVAPIGQPHDLLRAEGWLPYLLAALPRALGFSGAAAVKLILATSLLAGALGTYGWARRHLGPWPALLASCVYAFWPLGLVTTYVRGAFGETVFLGLLPFVWWAFETAREPGRRRAALLAAFALAAGFTVQAGLACWLAALVLVYLLCAGLLSRTRASAAAPGSRLALLSWAAGVLLGLLNTLAGAAAQHGLSNNTYVNFMDHLVYPHQLLQPGWSLTPSLPGPYNPLPLQLGLVACGLALLGVVLALADPGEQADPGVVVPGLPFSRSHLWLRVALALLPVLLSLALAAPLWRALPGLARTLTYPWQLLLLAGPWLAWLAGFGGYILAWRFEIEEPALAHIPLFAGLIGLALLGVHGNLNPPSTPARVPERPLAVFGDNEIALVSAAISGTVGSGNTVAVHVQWQALRPMDQDYTVFFHALGPDGTRWGQQDSMPRNNKLPTSRWRPGAVIEDEYRVTLQPGAPSGGYSFVLGWYQYQTGQRLLAGGDDKFILPERR